MVGRKYFLISSFAFLTLLGSCAQVQELVGGPEDVSAPKPDSLGMQPPNESVSFTSKTVSITFNEYIKLNNAAENIKIIPNDSKINATVIKKKLILEFLDTLQANTTYAVYLNGAVQDLTEQNDSLMTYVFSTGENIDSNAINVLVRNDFTQQLTENCVVGLYEPNVNPSKTPPRFFAKTNNTGMAKLSYLKEGNYQLFAFDDKNRNLLLDPTEKAGFHTSSVSVSDSALSYNLGIFPRTKTDTTVQFQAPGSFTVSGTNVALFAGTWSTHTTEKIKKINADSVVVYFQNNVKFSDSLRIRPQKTIRWTEKEKTTSLSASLGKTNIYPGDSIVVRFNDALEAANFDVYFDDTIKGALPQRSKNFNEIVFYDFPKNTKKVTFRANPKTITSLNTTNSDTLKLSATLFNADDLGTIVLYYENAKTAQRNLSVDVLDGATILANYAFTPGKVLQLHNIKPGSYTLRVVHDADNNLRWTPGNLENQTPSEKVVYYSKPIKVRAGWDIEVSF
jgi:uncharacterized protein (DUF2141 family)